MKRRSFRPEKEFGLVVGGVFVLLSLWWLYRGKFTGVAEIALPGGGILMVLGLLYPRVLVLPNRAWMTLAEGLSFITTRIILAFVFFVVLMPIGLIKRAMGWDPLRRRATAAETYWRPYADRQRNPRHYEKMF